MEQQHPKPVDLWKNRRRMAYSCLIAGFVVIAAVILDPDRFKDIESIFTTMFMFLGAVVGCYMGFSSYENVKMK